MGLSSRHSWPCASRNVSAPQFGASPRPLRCPLGDWSPAWVAQREILAGSLRAGRSSQTPLWFWGTNSTSIIAYLYIKSIEKRLEGSARIKLWPTHF